MAVRTQLRKFTEEHKRRIGDAQRKFMSEHPEARLERSKVWKGKKRSAETRLKMSNTKKKFLLEHPEYLDKLASSRRRPEVRAKISVGMSHWAKMYPDRVLKNLDKMNSSHYPTSLEVNLQHSFELRDLIVIPQYRVNLPNGTFVKIDGVNLQYMIAAFSDGCYHHRCLNPDCYTGRRNLHVGDYLLHGHKNKHVSEVEARDQYVTETLITQGWHVIRAWGHEFDLNPDIIGQKIDNLKLQKVQPYNPLLEWI